MIRFFAILFCLTLGLRAQEKEKAPLVQHNFLFVIDSSLSMATRKETAVQMVRELITNRFEGQIEAGDSIDIWTFDEENHISSFPPQIWVDSEARQIADAAAGFIESVKFKGRSRFEPVARDIDALLPHSKRLLIVILTDGQEPMSGISLDLDINAFVAKEKRTKPNAKLPFQISIAAVNGRFREWSAYCDIRDQVLASLPKRSKPAPVVAAATQPKALEKKVEPKREPKKEQETPMIFELPPGARLALPAPAPKTVVPVTQPVAAPVKEEPKTLQPTNAVAAAVPPVKTNAVELPRTNAPALAAKTSVEPPAPPATKLPEPVAKIKDEPVDLAAVPNAAATKISSEPEAKVVSPVTTKTKAISTHEDTAPLPQATISAGMIFSGVAAAGFAIIALGGLLFLKRAKAREGGSIISRSLLR
jgi:hypothetical protein